LRSLRITSYVASPSLASAHSLGRASKKRAGNERYRWSGYLRGFPRLEYPFSSLPCSTAFVLLVVRVTGFVRLRNKGPVGLGRPDFSGLPGSRRYSLVKGEGGHVGHGASTQFLYDVLNPIQEFRAGGLTTLLTGGRKPTPVDPRERRLAELERHVAQLTARAERAEALVELQKKLAVLLGRPLESERA